jgi:OFA family oxalate/formate antiporter-like MFS transporter
LIVIFSSLTEEFPNVEYIPYRITEQFVVGLDRFEYSSNDSMSTKTSADRVLPQRQPAQSHGVHDASFVSKPWVQLGVGVVCMAMVANLQFGWTIFVNPIDAKYHFGKAAIQVVFTLFILLQTWLLPFEAYLVDRFGPRLLVMAASGLVAASWILYSRASTLGMLYAGGVIGGIGTGLVYGTCVGNAVKWFDKRRGLASGITAAGFSSGAAITVVPLMRSLAVRGYQATLFDFALIQGGIILIAALALKEPASGANGDSNSRLPQTTKNSSPIETLRCPVFWMMYVAFALIAASGLMITAQIAPIASSFGVAHSPITLVGLTLPTLTLALSMNNVMNAVGRPLSGWASDVLGREFTLCAASCVGAVALLFLVAYGNNPLAFVILGSLVFLTWDIYSIFPALTSDQFGKKYATTNYALLYTAKGTAALFVPLGSLLALRTKSWNGTLVIAAIADVTAALILIAMVRPLRVRELRQQEVKAYGPDASTEIVNS